MASILAVAWASPEELLDRLHGHSPAHQPWSVPSWQLLCRCFQAWQHLAQERGMAAVTLAVALGRRQLLQKGLRALRWALQLRNVQLEAAGQRHRKALLARSFQEVSDLWCRGKN